MVGPIGIIGQLTFSLLKDDSNIPKPETEMINNTPIKSANSEVREFSWRN